jgi:hypothetical protein
MRTDDSSESGSTEVVRRYALAVLSAILALLLRRLAAPFLGEITRIIRFGPLWVFFCLVLWPWALPRYLYAKRLLPKAETEFA